MKRVINIGDVFGDLVVIDNTRVKRKDSFYVLMRCKCGKEYYVQVSSLFCEGEHGTKRCKECALKRWNEQRELAINIGDKSGEWTVIEYPIYKEWRTINQKMVKVRCSCGNERLITPSAFLNPNKYHQCRKCAGGGKLESMFRPGFITKLKRNAAKRGIEFSDDITPSYLYDILRIQKYRCALTGEKLIDGDKELDYNSTELLLSLDRIDSSKAYIPGNVQWVLKDINIMKWQLPQQKFIELCKKVAIHANQQPS